MQISRIDNDDSSCYHLKTNGYASVMRHIMIDGQEGQ